MPARKLMSHVFDALTEIGEAFHGNEKGEGYSSRVSALKNESDSAVVPIEGYAGLWSQLDFRGETSAIVKSTGVMKVVGVLKGQERIARWELNRKLYRKVKLDEIDNALSVLESKGAIKIEKTPTSSRPKTTVVVLTDLSRFELADSSTTYQLSAASLPHFNEFREVFKTIEPGTGFIHRDGLYHIVGNERGFSLEAKAKLVSEEAEREAEIIARGTKVPITNPQMTKAIAYELLSTDRTFLEQMSPRSFEQFISVLYFNMGFDTTLTPSSRDHGVDVIALREDKSFLIQCKHTESPEKAQSRRGIEGVLSGRASYSKRYNTEFGLIVITNAREFTSHAIEAATDNDIQLITKNELWSMIDRHHAIDRYIKFVNELNVELFGSEENEVEGGKE